MHKFYLIIYHLYLIVYDKYITVYDYIKLYKIFFTRGIQVILPNIAL